MSQTPNQKYHQIYFSRRDEKGAYWGGALGKLLQFTLPTVLFFRVPETLSQKICSGSYNKETLWGIEKRLKSKLKLKLEPELKQKIETKLEQEPHFRLQNIRRQLSLELKSSSGHSYSQIVQYGSEKSLAVFGVRENGPKGFLGRSCFDCLKFS